MEHFHFISDAGKTNLPSRLEKNKHFNETGEKTILVLDSSVCIDIRNIVKWKQDTKTDKKKIFNLIEYAQKNEIEWLSLLGLIESCYDRKSFELKSEDLKDLKNKIDFAFYYPVKQFKKFKFNFETDYIAFYKSEGSTNTVKILIDENIHLYYVALLKITSISQKGLGKKLAEKNIEEFITWMIEDLDILLGIEYTLALQIFGGNTKFQSIIKLGAIKEKVLQAAWGTAWDLLHARMSRNKEQLSIILGRKVYPIFVTKDNSLFELLSPQVNFHIRDETSKFSVTEENNYPPNYSDTFMQYLNEKMLNLSVDRIGIPHTINSAKLKNMIIDLENSL